MTAFADDQSIVVPCRVTNPDAKVTLETESLGRPLEISALESTQYDPKQGFDVVEQLHSFGNQLRCVAQLDLIEDEQVFTFNYIGKFNDFTADVEIWIDLF